MKRFLLTMTLLALPGSARAQQFPTTPPPAAPLRTAEFPAYQEATLSNGVRMVVVNRPAHPVLSVTLMLPAGSIVDPAGKAGLSSIAAQLLTKGAGGRNAEQVAAAIGAVGGSFAAGADADFMVLGAGVLRGDAALAFDLVADAVREPAFEARELELIRGQMLQGLQLNAANPAAIASRVFAHRLYGAHPYGTLESAATVSAVTRDDLLAFQRDRLEPAGALLVVAGQVTLADAKRLAETAFTGWTGSPAAMPAHAAPQARTSAEILLVDRPGSVQANLVVGNITPSPAPALLHATTVANRILGVGVRGRLFQVLREQKGWTYGAYSSAVTRKGPSHHVTTAEVRTEVADSALAELLGQLTRMGSEPVTAAELDDAKSAIVGNFPLSTQTADQVATQVANAILYGLPQDYLRTYRTGIAAVTAAQVQAASRALIRPAEAVIVVVGDAAKLRPQLERIGRVTLVDASGSAVAPSAAAAYQLDMSRMREHTDSFTIMVQGTPMGWQRETTTRTAGGWRFVEDAQIASMVTQHTELEIDAAGRATRVRQTGTMQGMQLDVNVTYAAGRATGTAKVPGPQGSAESAVNHEVPADVVDDNGIIPLVPALPWKPGAEMTVPTFAASGNALRVTTLKVTGVETVTVPAGSFEAYRVEMTGGPQPTTLWVTTASPHRIVRIAPTGAPVEIVLAK